jgi:outer membrane protein TolC
MKHWVSIGLLLATTSAWGQVPGEPTDAQPLCTPFVRYATILLTYVERAEETGRVVSAYAAARHVADATLKCAEADTRLWSRADADAQFVRVQRQFDVGISTSAEVSGARVGVEKANYCEAAFSHLTQTVQQYERRREVGLVSAAAFAPVLGELEALAPVCGWSSK